MTHGMMSVPAPTTPAAGDARRAPVTRATTEPGTSSISRKATGLARRIVAAALIGLATLIVGPITALAQPQMSSQMQMPSAEIEILSFRHPTDPTMATSSITGSPSSSSVQTINANAGETVLFSWVVRVRKASRVTAVIAYGSRTIDLMLGTPRNEADGWKRYENQRNVTVTEAGLYTLRVSGFPGGGSRSSAEKSVQVNVREGGISSRQPRVDPATRRVTFVVHATGDVPAEGRFTVRYQIQGRNPMRPLVESSLTTAAMTVQPGQDADLGHVDLPESASQSAQLWMRVSISLTGRAGVPDTAHDYTYDWPDHELRITTTQLSALGQLLGGDILIHNYNDPHADTTDSLPLLNDASQITLLGRSFTYSFGRIVYDVGGVEHIFFINNFHARLGGADFLNIVDGKIVMRANFDCGANTREAKGWTRDWVLKRYVDNTTPDVDIQRMNLQVVLTPRLAAGKLSYSDVTLSIDSLMRFPGGWAWLNGFKDWMNREVQKSVRANFASVLNDASIKGTIETELGNVLALAARPNEIHQILSVRGAGDTITVTYR
jgi:hypothetical protein